MEHTGHRLKKDFFLFDSFGVIGLRNFIVQDDKKLVKKVLKGVENISSDKTELNLVLLKFSVDGYNNLLDQVKLLLFETANDLFHLIKSFASHEKQKNINMWVLEDPIQELTTNTCGPYQLYFYENLFFLDNENKLYEYKKLTKEAVQDLLNKIFLIEL